MKKVISVRLKNTVVAKSLSLSAEMALYHCIVKILSPYIILSMYSFVSLLSGIYRQSPVKTPDIKT